MRKLVLCGAVGLAAVFSLAGCGSVYSGGDAVTPAPTASTAAEGQDSLTGEPYTFYVTLPNKNKVFCVGVNGYYGDAPSNFSCDWANAQRLNKNYVG